MQSTSSDKSISLLDFPEIRARVATFLDRKDCVALMRVSRDCISLYKGSSLRYLSASLAQIWTYDIEDSSAPCLLEHFPLLVRWDVSSLAQPKYRTIDLKQLDFSIWCPLLKEIVIAYDSTNSAEDMSTMLLHSFGGLESCTLSVQDVTMPVPTSLLSHQESLTSITIFGKIQGTESMQCLYLILKMCQNLRVISFEQLVYDLDWADTFRWNCQDLQVLRMRFKNLDTPKSMGSCIKHICDWRRFDRCAWLLLEDAIPMASQVAEFLTQFKMLTTVWFGTRNYYLSASPS
ncbi:hypothetical protein BG015_011965 [Linnemannia schmuckeri]|uniref:Uncharacterized protein n=1 Tax=Linnemannia schmuckeri TaxID=64567 RepID=A0A9P5V7I0_9FUNG|nr:hypothetical protein BG015_011965 [Linnemannia schmuckeri]